MRPTLGAKNVVNFTFLKYLNDKAKELLTLRLSGINTIK